MCKVWWNITKNTGAGAPAMNSVYSLYLKHTLTYQSHPSRKNSPFLVLEFFVFFLPQNQFQCIWWHAENTNRVIFSCHHVEMTHLNCRTVGQRFLTVVGTLLVTQRQGEEILLLPSPPKQSVFCFFFASSNVSFGLIREALHRFNGCANIWSAPGIFKNHT